jgi:hypothetical protein
LKKEDADVVGLDLRFRWACGWWQGSLDNINLFSIITIMSFFLLAPATLLVEGVKFTPSYLQAAVSLLSAFRVPYDEFSLGIMMARCAYCEDSDLQEWKVLFTMIHSRVL